MQPNGESVDIYEILTGVKDRPIEPWEIILAAAVVLLVTVALWRLFEKAGRHGWEAVIPVYNLYVWCKLTYGSGWYCISLIIPILNIISYMVLSIKTAYCYGKGFLFGGGILLLPPVFLLWLAFGDARYEGAEDWQERGMDKDYQRRDVYDEHNYQA